MNVPVFVMTILVVFSLGLQLSMVVKTRKPGTFGEWVLLTIIWAILLTSVWIWG